MEKAFERICNKRLKVWEFKEECTESEEMIKDEGTEKKGLEGKEIERNLAKKENRTEKNRRKCRRHESSREFGRLGEQNPDGRNMRIRARCREQKELEM